MDLSIVNRKLTDGHYSTPAEFCSDMNLIFNNAKTYNQTRSQVMDQKTSIVLLLIYLCV